MILEVMYVNRNTRGGLLIFVTLFTIQVVTVSSHGVLIDTKGTSKGSNPFIPTKEWQIVNEGQAIPPGLHVRYNLQTGLVEAKLLDKDAEKNKEGIPLLVKKGEKVPLGITKRGVTHTPQDEEKPTVSGRTDSTLSREHIMEAMKKLAEQDDVKDKKIADEAKARKFRSYDDLKKDFEKLNVKLKTDIQIIKELVSKLNNTNSTVEEKVVALTDLEYYLHQIDNAIDFMKMDGLNLLLDEMNSQDWRLRSEAVFAIGSAMQSNVKVQIRALELGLLKSLKRHIMGESQIPCLNRILYSLSILLRNFPYAQLKFVRDGGMEAMIHLFHDKERGKSRLQVRMVTLLHDLVSERMDHESRIDRSDRMQVEKLRQYEQVNMASQVVRHGWCRLVPRLLSLPDHDSREKVLSSLITFHQFCPEQPAESRREMLRHLVTLESQYRSLAAEETSQGEKDGYFNSLLDRVLKLRAALSKRPDDEL